MDIHIFVLFRVLGMGPFKTFNGTLWLRLCYSNTKIRDII